MNLVMMFNQRKVLSNTLIVRQGQKCAFLYIVKFGQC